jgi:membrane protein implicated in regulation of membrane protease activity
MKTNLAMGLGGLAAMVIDFVVVASIVGLLLLSRWIGVGWMLDVLTILAVSYLIILWFYAKRFSQFLNRQDVKGSNAVPFVDGGQRVLIKSGARSSARSQRPGSRLVS